MVVLGGDLVHLSCPVESKRGITGSSRLPCGEGCEMK